MASLRLHLLSNLHSSPTLLFQRNPHQIPSLHFPLKPCQKVSRQKRCLTVSFALTESDSPKSIETQSLLQDLADSFALPPDYLAQLPRDLRLDLNDAAFDLANGPVIDECGQELGETLLNLSRAWELADTSTSCSLASKLPSLEGSLTNNAKSAFGKRLVSAGRRFESMGLYGQGELQRVISKRNCVCPMNNVLLDLINLHLQLSIKTDDAFLIYLLLICKEINFCTLGN
uniref:Uncharacterized protein n=1 Tax=Nelumbo nucifera TaxID=4432 RepID=A0A822XF56_NELNU|nr:TPA_asm: hypothetical protein HUJ06_021557 [Nelumbo nucifera]